VHSRDLLVSVDETTWPRLIAKRLGRYNAVLIMIMAVCSANSLMQDKDKNGVEANNKFSC